MTMTTTDAATDTATAKDEQSKVVVREEDYWNTFYSAWDIGVPSQFCVLVATEADRTRPFVEFGCGNGRDSIYMSRCGFSITAGDLSKEAIQHNRKKEGGEENKNAADFQVCDVANADNVEALITRARGKAPEGTNLNLYNRFFLHSLDDEQERLFLTSVAANSKPGDTLYMEYRSLQDAKQDKIFKGHYRRYVDTDALMTFLVTLGFQVEYERTGQGMAKYKKEDPFVSRLIVVRV
jgi:tellurite methyltransferase